MIIRKSILIIIVVAAVAFAVLLLYYFFVRRAAPTSENQGQNATTGDLPASGAADSSNPAAGISTAPSASGGGDQAGAVSESSLADQAFWMRLVVASSTGGAALVPGQDRLAYYDTVEKSLLTVNFLGADPMLLGAPQNEAVEVGWSPDCQGVLGQTGDNTTFFYDTVSGTETVLGNSLAGADFWDGTGRIYYQYQNRTTGISNLSLATIAAKLADYSVLAQMNGRLKMQRVPQSNKLGYYLEPDANRAAAVYTVDVESQQKEILLNQATGLDVSWSPDGQKMVFNKIGATGQLELYLADGSGHDAKRLETATYVTKLAWSHDSRYLYLAVPRNMPAVNDFYKKGAKTEDILWQLDLETGEKIFAFDSRYGDVQRKVDAREMILAPNGDLLFFKNAHDQSIYVANLKRLRADQVNGFPAFIE